MKPRLPTTAMANLHQRSWSDHDTSTGITGWE